MTKFSMGSSVDDYFKNGCGRCHLGGTPQCKVHFWPDELAKLRAIVLDCGLQEVRKWGVPVYTFNKKNILIVAALKEYCSISFFKGALMNDPKGLLHRQTKNMQAVRIIRFTNVREIIDAEPTLKAYIKEAIEFEKAGAKLKFKETSKFAMPEELQSTLNNIPALKKAFEALTPGRQRGYILFFSAPKQSKTRQARIEKYMQQILKGKGLHD